MKVFFSETQIRAGDRYLASAKRPALLAVLLAATLPAFGQGHNALDGTGMKDIAFLEGDWHGKQNFNVPGGSTMVADIVNHITEAVGGRYLEEKLATTLPGKKPTDVRHFITYDPTTKVYKAWWFNDTRVGPMEFEGALDQGKLVFQSKPGGGPNVFRATYEPKGATGLDYKFELQTPTGWQTLFTSSYTK